MSDHTAPRPTDDIRLVRQEHDYGCGLAALAMVTGQSYEDVREWLVANWPAGHERSDEWLVKRGIYDGLVDYFLGRHGFAWRTVYSGWEQEPWPPEPFAPVHLAMVRQPSNNSHYVVMRSDGVVLDPLTDEPRTLTDWDKVSNVRGVWRLAAVERERDEARAQLETVAAQLRQCIEERNHRIKERVAAEALLAAVGERASLEIADAKAGETYAAEVNEGALLYAEQARRTAWEAVQRLLAAPSPQAEPATSPPSGWLGL